MGNLCSEKRDEEKPTAPNPASTTKPLFPNKKDPPNAKVEESSDSSAQPPVVNPPRETEEATKQKASKDEGGQAPKQLIGGMGGVGPRWTWDSTVEKPAGEKDMGTWKRAVYTAEQQARLGVDEDGKPVEAGAPADSSDDKETGAGDSSGIGGRERTGPRGGQSISVVEVTYSQDLGKQQQEEESKEAEAPETKPPDLDQLDPLGGMDSLPPQTSLPPAALDNPANQVNMDVDLDGGATPADEEKRETAQEETVKPDGGLEPTGETIHQRASMTDFSKSVAEVRDKAILESFQPVKPDGFDPIPEDQAKKPEYPVAVADNIVLNF